MLRSATCWSDLPIIIQTILFVRTLDRKTFRPIFRPLERLTTSTSKPIRPLEDLGKLNQKNLINQVTEPNLCFRGFAFVVFKTISSLQDAVNEQEHSVKGKKVAVKKAKAKEGKIYVGKLKPELSDEEIKNHFAQFGNISQV